MSARHQELFIDFDAIKARHPLAEYCRERGIELHREGGSGELVGLCPLHQEKTGSFYVYPDDHYHCYGCGAHGDVTDLEQARGDGTRAEAVLTLGGEWTQDVAPLPKQQTEPRPGPDLSAIKPCSESDLEQIAKLRSIPLVGLRLARDRNL